MTETSPCPRCGTPGSGNFCPNCGASRGSTSCPACGHTPEPGARFCTRCGKPLNAGVEARPPTAPPATAPAAEGAGGARDGNLGWWVAGLALVALILFVAYPVLSGPGTGGPPPAPASAPAAGRATPDVLSMDPREAADRLYNRVMEAASARDSAEVLMFLPMSIAAYDRARPLDDDGLYHLSVLQRTSGDDAASLATAREILERSPDHLLALGAAAEAAGALGDSAQALDYWRHLLDVYEEESAAGLPEYRDHALIMGELQSRARSATGG